MRPDLFGSTSIWMSELNQALNQREYDLHLQGLAAGMPRKYPRGFFECQVIDYSPTCRPSAEVAGRFPDHRVQGVDAALDVRVVAAPA